jgi:hypothetical protein
MNEPHRQQTVLSLVKMAEPQTADSPKPCKMAEPQTADSPEPCKNGRTTHQQGSVLCLVPITICDFELTIRI